MVSGNETEDVRERGRGLILDILWTFTCVGRAKLVQLASLVAGRSTSRGKNKILFQKRPEWFWDTPSLLFNG
jgi:hypothetical protein